MADITDDSIGQYWNQLGTSGRRPDVALDPTLAETIGQMHSLSQAPLPGSARERARQRIFASDTRSQESDMPTLVLNPPSVNGRSALSPPVPFPKIPAVPKPPILSRRALLSLAAAILIAFASFGGYLAEQRYFGRAPSQQPAVIPAVEQTAMPGDDWPMYRGNPARTGTTPGNALTSLPGVVWSTTLDGSAFRGPVVVGDIAFVGTARDTLYALDATNGDVKWEFKGEGSLEMTPAYLDGVVYVPSLLGTLYAVDAVSGAELWRFDQPLAEYATPTFGEGLLFVGSEWSGEIYGIDQAAGEEVWRFEADGAVNRTQAYADGVVYSSSRSGNIYALDAADGTLLWRFDTQSESVGTVAVSDGKVYAVGDNGALIVVDASSGDEIARIDTSYPDGIALPAVRDGIAYIGTQSGAVAAIDTESGQVLWTTETGGAIRVSPMLIADVLYANSANNVLYALDATSGEELWSYQLDGEVSTGPAFANGMIYVSTASGVIVALGESSGEASASAAATPSSDGTPAATAPGIDESLIELVWTLASSDDVPIGNPHGIDIAPDGNVYVADASLNAVHVFAPDGTHLETWGEPGTDPGQFQGPEDIGIDADGNVYVFDIGNSRIQKFGPDHTFLLEWGTAGTGNGEFIEVHGYVDRENELVYVVEFTGNRIQVFDLDGNFIDKWGGVGPGNGQFRQPAVASTDDEGNVYVGDTNNGSNGRVQKFDSLGTWQATLGGGGGGSSVTFSEIWGIAFDAGGNMFVADYWANSIQVFGPDLEHLGVITDIPGAGPMNHPLRLRFDAEGFLYILDWDNQRVLKIGLPPIDATA